MKKERMKKEGRMKVKREGGGREKGDIKRRNMVEGVVYVVSSPVLDSFLLMK